MMALKAQNALQTQVHEALYNNISVLTYLYPPHPDFKLIFKKDMFVKNNKTAFIHVVYYLLHALDPSRIKEKISTWPILDVSYERQFRTEVVKYLNELNDIYEKADMPSIMPSQLVSPGGFRFVKYMLKLSVLVVKECLSNSYVVSKMIAKSNSQKRGGGTEEQIKRINKLALHINRETEQLRLDFHNNFIKLKDEADGIVNRFNEVQDRIRLSQEKLNTFGNSELTKAPNDNMESLNGNLLKIQGISDMLSKIKDKLEYITKANLTLESPTSEELNLITFFKKFNLEMENHCLEMTAFTELELESYIRKFEKCNVELDRLKNDLNVVHKQWINLSGDMKTAKIQSQNCKKVLQKPNLFPLALGSGDSTILALPLDASE